MIHRSNDPNPRDRTSKAHRHPTVILGAAYFIAAFTCAIVLAVELRYNISDGYQQAPAGGHDARSGGATPGNRDTTGVRVHRF